MNRIQKALVRLDRDSMKEVKTLADTYICMKSNQNATLHKGRFYHTSNGDECHSWYFRDGFIKRSRRELIQM